jgi:hypothetical protein
MKLSDSMIIYSLVLRLLCSLSASSLSSDYIVGSPSLLLSSSFLVSRAKFKGVPSVEFCLFLKSCEVTTKEGLAVVALVGSFLGINSCD